MDCKNSQTFIVDYFLDDLDEISKENLLDHLKSCNECRSSYVKYKELLNISRIKDSEDIPRYEIIDRLQQIARMNSNKDESRWKRLFQLPVLVPVVSAAMAIMIFFNLDSNTNVNTLSINEPQEQIEEFYEESVVMADSSVPVDYSSQISLEKEKELKYVAKSEPYKQNSTFDNSLVVRSDYSPNFSKKVSISRIDDDYSIVTKAKPQFIKNVDSKYFSSSPTEVPKSVQVTKDNSSELKSSETSIPVIVSDSLLKEDIVGKDVSLNSSVVPLESLEVASADRRGNSQLLNIKNKEGIESTFVNENSENRIILDKSEICDQNKYDKQILQETDDIDLDQSKRSYISLAECYELNNNWQKAIDNYIYLQKIDLDGADRYQKKIDYIMENHIKK